LRTFIVWFSNQGYVTRGDVHLPIGRDSTLKQPKAEREKEGVCLATELFMSLRQSQPLLPQRMRDISSITGGRFRTGRQVARLPTISATDFAHIASRQGCGRMLQLSEWKVNISGRLSLHCYVPGSFVTDSENAYS